MDSLYFILDPDQMITWWSSGLTPEISSRIAWSYKYKFKKWNIRCKEIIFIYLKNRSKIHSCHLENKPGYSGPIKNLSLMKSCVQKCYRRLLTDQCIRGFRVLAEINSKSALKRLGIIILEDSLYTWPVNTLIWLQTCHCYFNFSLGLNEWTFIYKLIYYYCEVFKWRGIEIFTSDLWNAMQDNDTITIDSLIDQINELHLDQFQQDQLLSLLLYSDKNKFTLEADKKLAIYQIKRFLHDWPQSPSDPLGLVLITSIPDEVINHNYLNPQEILPVSCDFHCDSLLIYLITKELNLVSSSQITEQIKSAIWYCSSRLNYRSHLNLVTRKEERYPELEEEIKINHGFLWDLIKDTCIRIMTNRCKDLFTEVNIYHSK